MIHHRKKLNQYHIVKHQKQANHPLIGLWNHAPFMLKTRQKGEKKS